MTTAISEQEPVVLYLDEPDDLNYYNGIMRGKVLLIWAGQDVCLRGCRRVARGWFYKDEQLLHNGREECFWIRDFKRENNGHYQFTAHQWHQTPPGSGRQLFAIDRPSSGGSGFCLVPIDYHGHHTSRCWKMMQGNEVRFFLLNPAMFMDFPMDEYNFTWDFNGRRHLGRELVVQAAESQQPGVKDVILLYKGEPVNNITLSITEPSTIESGVVWLNMNLVSAGGKVLHWSRSDKWPVCRQGVLAGGRMEFICACQDDQILHRWIFRRGSDLTQLFLSRESRLVLAEVGYNNHGEYYCMHEQSYIQMAPPGLESQHCFLAVLEPTMKQSTWDMYMKQLSEGSTIIFEQRIILCGPGRAGKSSVGRSLFGEKFRHRLDSTVGMELSRACCTAECTDEGMKWTKVKDEDEHRDMLLATAMSRCAAQELGNDILQESLWVAREDEESEQPGHRLSGTRQDGGEQRQPEEDPSMKETDDLGEPVEKRRHMKKSRKPSEDQIDTNQRGVALRPRVGKRRTALEETQRGCVPEGAKRAKGSRVEKVGSQALTCVGSNRKETYASPMDRHLSVPTRDVLAMAAHSSTHILADQHGEVSQSGMEELHTEQSILPMVTTDPTCTSIQSDSHGLAFSNSDQFHSTYANSPAESFKVTNPKPPSGVSLEPQQAKAPTLVRLEQAQPFEVTARSAIKATKQRIRNMRRNFRILQQAASKKWRFITLWDFAGQEAFAIVQHLLMSHIRTAYGVVYNALWPLDDIASEYFGKQGQEIEVERETTAMESNFDVLTGWLDVLHHVFSQSTNTSYSPLLYIICTHADKMSQKHRHAFRRKILKRIEGKPYECDIRDVVFVDNTRSGKQGCEDPTVAMLRTEFITAMQSDSYMQTPIPLKWLSFIMSLRELKRADSGGYPILPLPRVQEIATNSCAPDGAGEMDALISFCHSLGHILHFTDNERLSQKVVIDVQWLVKVVSLLFVPISVYEKLPSNRQFVDQYRLLYTQGILLETLAVHIWSQNLPLEYAEHLQAQEQRTFLFDLMEEYGLLISASDSPAMPGDKSTRKYWVPAMVGLEITEDQEEDAAFSRMEKESQQAPVQRSLPVYLHCSNGQQFPRSLFWRLVARCMQHYRQVGDSEGALPILYRSSVRLLCDSAHWLLLRRYQCGLQIIVEQELSPLEDQMPLSSVCHRVLAVVEKELASLVMTSFGKFTWRLSARCRCSAATSCKNHQRFRCPFVDCQHFVLLDKPRCLLPKGMQRKQDVSAIQSLWLSKKSHAQVSGGKSESESAALPAASIRAVVTRHFEAFQELISAKRFLRPFYEEMLLSPRVVKAINCEASAEDANRKFLEAVITSDDSRTLAMFVLLLGQHGCIGLIETLLACPGANCRADGNSCHGNNPDTASVAASGGLLSQPIQLAPGSVLNEADSQLFELAQRLAFTSFELEYFAELLLENSGCHQSGKVFLAGLDVGEVSTVPHKTLAVLQYWIRGAPGPSCERHGGQLKVVLEKLERNNVIRDFNAYLNNGTNRPESKRSHLALPATDNNSAPRG